MKELEFNTIIIIIIINCTGMRKKKENKVARLKTTTIFNVDEKIRYY